MANGSDQYGFTLEELPDIVREGPPRFLYHATSSALRQQIEEEGLCTRYSHSALISKDAGDEDWAANGAIYFSTVAETPSPTLDVWVLDTSGLEYSLDEWGPEEGVLRPDLSVDFGTLPDNETWWHIYADVPPHRLKLHELCFGVEGRPEELDARATDLGSAPGSFGRKR